MKYTNPLDFLSAGTVESKLRSLREEVEPFFGESSMGEVTLPDDEFGSSPSGEESEYGDDIPEHEESETPGEKADEHSSDPRDMISELKRKISDLKEEITEKLKPLFPEDREEELAEALDDATSALDLCDHHLSDIDNKLSGEAPNEVPEGEPLEDEDEESLEGSSEESLGEFEMSEEV